MKWSITIPGVQVGPSGIAVAKEDDGDARIDLSIAAREPPFPYLPRATLPGVGTLYRITGRQRRAKATDALELMAKVEAAGYDWHTWAPECMWCPAEGGHAALIDLAHLGLREPVARCAGRTRRGRCRAAPKPGEDVCAQHEGAACQFCPYPDCEHQTAGGVPCAQHQNAPPLIPADKAAAGRAELQAWLRKEIPEIDIGAGCQAALDALQPKTPPRDRAAAPPVWESPHRS